MFLNTYYFNIIFIHISEIFLFFSIFFIFLFSSFYFRKLKKIVGNIEILTKNLSLFILFIYLYFILFSLNYEIDIEIYMFNNIVKITKIVLTLITIWIISQKKSLTINGIYFFEIPILFLSSLLSFSLMLVFCNLFLVYLFIELQSLIFIIFVGIQRNKNSFDSALKYFIFGSLGSCFILYSLSIIFGFFGTLNLYHIIEIQFTASTTDLVYHIEYSINKLHGPVVKIFDQFFYCFIFLILGIFMKIGAFPFYYWVPNVYQGSSNTIVAYFSTVSYLSYFIFLLNLFLINNQFFQLFFDYIYIASVGSFFIGIFGSLYQTSIKRFMAYNSILNIGLIFAGLIPFLDIEDIIPENDYIVTVIFIYFIFYTIINISNWSIMLSSIINKKPLEYLTDLSVLYVCNPFIAYSLIIGLLSMAGLPPFMGFTSKFFLVYLLCSVEMFFFGFFILIFSSISIFYYLRILKIMIFDNLKTESYIVLDRIDLNESFIIAILTHILIFYYIYINYFLLSLRLYITTSVA